MDSISKRCLACGWPANNGDKYCCKCGGKDFVMDKDFTSSYSLYEFPSCECLPNGRTIQYKPSYRDAEKITLLIKDVCQVLDSYIIYVAEKIVGGCHSDIEVAELFIKGRDHRSPNGEVCRICFFRFSKNVEQSFFDFIVQDSGIPISQVFEYYNDEYGLSENCIRANNTLYYVLTKPFCNNDNHAFKTSIGKTTLPLDSVIAQHGKRCGWGGWGVKEDETICSKCGRTLLQSDMRDPILYDTPDIEPRATIYGPPTINSRAILNRSPKFFGSRIRISYTYLFVIILLGLIVLGLSYLRK